ncbi:hypothetical protein GHT06_008226 [Daphnia sinensis]|uniref:Uncharacterized protein n=1 Tax=Daphnia sinensis TaxID=1820382 RepID=A0AAD5L3U7_9CRUS|nr:hypothetical protein GHT06_008226 [Daphnia sinensis]
MKCICRPLYNSTSQFHATQRLPCVLLSSTGKAISAGCNLKELMKDTSEPHHGLVFSTCTSLMKLLLNCPFPVVAKVDGIAAAAGCQLIAMCDIVVASMNSMFSTTVVCTRSIPMKMKSTIYALLLDSLYQLKSEEALKAGLLVSRVVMAEQLELQLLTPVIRLGKQFLQRHYKREPNDLSFKEKRKPQFQDK